MDSDDRRLAGLGGEGPALLAEAARLPAEAREEIRRLLVMVCRQWLSWREEVGEGHVLDRVE